MKFLSFEKLKSKHPGEYEAYGEIIDSHTDSPFCVYYKVRNYSSENIDSINNDIYKELEKIIENKVPKKITKKILVSDITNFSEGALGGGGFGIPVPDVEFFLKSAVVFMIMQSSSGFFQELGKDLYNWVKKNIKGYKIGNKANIKVWLRTNNYILTFMFFNYFEDKVFVEAWKKMLNFDVSSLELEKGEKGIFIYDTKTEKWVLVG